MRTAFPHSVAVSRRHLSPLRRERKGAKFRGLAPFLAPLRRERKGAKVSGLAPFLAPLWGERWRREAATERGFRDI